MTIYPKRCGPCPHNNGYCCMYYYHKKKMPDCPILLREAEKAYPSFVSKIAFSHYGHVGEPVYRWINVRYNGDDA